MAVGSWTEWSQYVLKELERHDECYKGLEKKHFEFRDCTKRELDKMKLKLQTDLENIRLEQVKIKTKIAIIVAILTTIGNGILFTIFKALWPHIKHLILA